MLSNIENKLKEKNIRPTSMRLLVLEQFSKQTAAISLQDLEAAFEKADRITLVSILALLANSFSLYLLQRAKSKEAHMQASMIFYFQRYHY